METNIKRYKMKDFRLEVFKRASLCRNFEQYVFDGIKKGLFKFPIYLSAGQEYISATIAEVMKQKQIGFQQQRRKLRHFMVEEIHLKRNGKHQERKEKKN